MRRNSANRIMLFVLLSFIFFVVFSPSTFAGDKPLHGGTLRAVRPSFPHVLGYPPEFAPADAIFAIPYAEMLLNWDEEGNLVPELATSWNLDPKTNTLVYHLRKGVRFHDGTPFNAAAVKWNMEQSLNAKRMTDGDRVKQVEVIDEHTIKLHLTEIDAMSIMNYGWFLSFSPTAFKKNGGKEWARMNGVGTGPFKVTKYVRDSLIRYERNDDYWRKGLPYLDAIEFSFVPDSATAGMMLKSGQTDSWIDGPPARDSIELEKLGFEMNWGPGMFNVILSDSSNPDSPFADKRVREAVEYAIDRPMLAKALGFGKFEPMTQLMPAASPANVPGYDPRPYNPEKARQLLAEAGYPDGFKTKLMAFEYSRNEAEAVKAFLSDVGIDANMDLADMGRYFGVLFGPPKWEGLILTMSGINPDGTDLFVHFGPNPMTFKYDKFYKSPRYLNLCQEALAELDIEKSRVIMRQAVMQASEDAMVIPLYRSSQAMAMAKYVHSDYVKIHGVSWIPAKDWIEKH